jgi:DNA polymerase I-like protein with 3'-5' exonuclease and polymerase domains
LHLPEHKAKELDGDFWDDFRGLKKWQDDLLRFYSKHNYVETLGGFRRRGAMSPNEVINMPIQGTACEIVVEAMIACSELAYTTDNWDIHPILNVHDDLTYDMEEDTMLENISIVAREMCKPRHSFVNVPLIVEVSVGDNWADLKGVAEYSSTEVWNIRNPYDDKKSNRNSHH